MGNLTRLILTICSTFALIGMLIYFLSSKRAFEVSYKKATECVRRREFPQALKHLEDADASLAKVSDKNFRSSHQFQIELARGLSWMAQDKTDQGVEYLEKALEIYEQPGFEMAGTPVEALVLLHSDLAVGYSVNGDDDSSRMQLQALEDYVNTNAANDRLTITSTLSGAAAGAATKNQQEIAFYVNGLAVRLIANADEEEPQLHAELLMSQASYALLLCHYGQARKILEQDLIKLSEKLDTDNKIQLANLSRNLEVTCGYPKEAVALGESQLELIVDSGGKGTLQEADALNGLLLAVMEYGDFAKAGLVAEEVAHFSERHLQPEDKIRLAFSLQRADFLRQTGRYMECDTCLASIESQPGLTDSPALHSFTFLMRAALAVSQRDPQPAIKSASDSIAIAESIYGKEEAILSDYLGILAIAYRQNGELEKSKEILQRIKSLRDAQPESGFAGDTQLMLRQAEILLAEEKFEEAVAASRKIVERINGRVLRTADSHCSARLLNAKALVGLGEHNAALERLNELEKDYLSFAAEDLWELQEVYRLKVAVFEATGDNQQAATYRSKKK